MISGTVSEYGYMADVELVLRGISLRLHLFDVRVQVGQYGIRNVDAEFKTLYYPIWCVEKSTFECSYPPLLDQVSQLHLAAEKS